MVAVKGPGDTARLLLTVLLALWVFAYGYSLVELSALAASGRPLGEGLDLGSSLHFLGWQGIAGVIAVGVFGVSRLWPRGAAARQLGNLPLALAFLLVAVIAALILAEGMAPGV